MHGFRHAPGSNHVCVSILGIFTFSFVICKYNLQSSDGAFTTLSPCDICRKGNHYFTNLCQNCKLLLTSRSFPSSPRSSPPFVPFFSCGLHPHLIPPSRFFRLQYYLILSPFRHPSEVHFLSPLAPVLSLLVPFLSCGLHPQKTSLILASNMPRHSFEQRGTSFQFSIVRGLSRWRRGRRGW